MGAAARLAERRGRRLIYLQSNCYHKEDLAREEMKRQGVKEGLITVISAVELCRTWFVRGNKQTRHLELKLNWGKCIHLYFYWLHQRLGFLHLRLQTWFPFLLQICFNGREWLARQMDRAGMAYRRRDNCFEWLQEPAKAQRLMNQQLQLQWQPLFEPILKLCHPLHPEICRPIGASYYWTVAESEYATDVMFKQQADLQAVYPAMVHHSIMSFGSQQVLRFLQRLCGKIILVYLIAPRLRKTASIARSIRTSAIGRVASSKASQAALSSLVAPSPAASSRLTVASTWRMASSTCRR